MSYLFGYELFIVVTLNILYFLIMYIILVYKELTSYFTGL